MHVMSTYATCEMRIKTDTTLDILSHEPLEALNLQLTFVAIFLKRVDYVGI